MMKRIMAGLLALLLAAACTACKQTQQQEPGDTPAPVTEQEPDVSGDPENPVKLYLDQFSDTFALTYHQAEEAAGNNSTLLPELLGAQAHVYALQTLLYGPANLLYTSANLFDGGIYGLLHGTGSVWQTEEEVSFSCTLNNGHTVTGTLQDDLIEARQSYEAAAAVEGEEQESAPVTVLFCQGMISKTEAGWYSCYWNENAKTLSMLYFTEDRLVFAPVADAILLEENLWLTTAPEGWGESCLLVQNGTAQIQYRTTAEEQEDH